MNLINDIEIGRKMPDEVNAVIEIPEGSHAKYEIDAKKGVLILDRVLHTSMHYPGNYGFIPQTLDKDGDPLDVVVICSVPLMPLTVAKVKPIGVMVMEDENGEDPKIIAVAKNDPEQSEINEINDLPKILLNKIEHFFKEYKSLEKDKWVKVKGFENSTTAKNIIVSCAEEYIKKRGK
jgi:inorganic pyrophosphatase